MNVRDAFFDVLRAHGMTTIFGNPGFTELPLLQDFPDDFRYVLVLQEGAAVAMADGFAQATGRPALVNLHTAAGTGNAMGTLTASQAAHIPVVIASGQQARRNTAVNAFLTNVRASKLPEPLVKWSDEPARAQDVPQTLSKAIFMAAAAPAGPVNISLPLDDWDQEADMSALGHLTSRAVDGDPVVAEQSLCRLRDRLASAANPVMVAGPGIDTVIGWEGAVRLAEQLAMPVLVSPMPFRCPFPTRHPNFRAILPDDSAGVASHFAGHDLVVAFGAAIFRYQVFTDGDQLTDGTQLWAVTSDPDEAARAPFGRILIGDPADALARLASEMPATTRFPLPARAPVPRADADGPAFTAEAIIDALDAAKDETTVIAHEWSSAATKWDRLSFARPGSMYFSASGTLGWGLPAAIGLQLGDPSRRVLAMLGDGSVHYTVSGLWTAAQHNIPVVFVITRNAEYAALKALGRRMDAPDLPGLDLPAMDIPAIATAYGIESARVESLTDLTSTVKHALASDQPQLIEVPLRRLVDSSSRDHRASSARRGRPAAPVIVNTG